MRKVLIALGCVVAFLVAGVFIFSSKLHEMVKYFREYSVRNIDLKVLPDGAYRGECSVFLVDAEVEATIQNHRISDIKLLKQRCSKGYEGKQVIDSVLKEQAVNVDAVARATASSKCILVALERALTKEGSAPQKR